MKRSNLFTTLSAWLLGVFLCMGSVTVFAVDEIGLFELEGNAVDNSGAPAPDDWQTLHLGGGSAAVFTGINADPDEESIFTGGRKDIQDISEWSHKDGAVPDKGDITNAYAAAYTKVGNDGIHMDGDLILYFGADRIINVGATFLGFWFFQDEVSADPIPEGDMTAGFTGDHINGDVLVLVNFPQAANAEPLIQVIKWDDTCPKALNNNPAPTECAAKNLRLVAGQSGAGAICVNTGAADQAACAITNPGTIASPWPYMSKDGFVNEFPFETFFEGGINLSLLFPNATGCFSSFMAETRSSESFTASLKDFRLDDFALCGIEATKSCDAALNDLGDTVTVNFDGTVFNSGARALEVTLSDDMGAITEVCFDTSGETGVCDDADVEPPALNGSVIVGNNAEFLLLAGETVVYEGTYDETDPEFNSDGVVMLSDTVTASAAVIDGIVEVVNDTADADCEAEGIPGIDINKECSAAKADGADLVVTINGTGSNDGQVKLLNVGITDSEMAVITLVEVDDDIPPQDTNFTEVTNGAFTLLPGQAYRYDGTLTIEDASTVAHTDTVTVSGTNFFDQTGDSITDTGDAECTSDTDPGVAITKECDVLLVAQADPARIVLKVDFNGVVTNTGDVELTNVTVTDSIVGDVSATLSKTTLAPGDTATYSGSYFPSVGAGQDVPDASELSTKDTASASGTGAFGVGTVNTDTDGTAASEEAECFLCDDDHDGIPDVLDLDSGDGPNTNGI